MCPSYPVRLKYPRCFRILPLLANAVNPITTSALFGGGNGVARRASRRFGYHYVAQDHCDKMYIIMDQSFSSGLKIPLPGAGTFRIIEQRNTAAHGNTGRMGIAEATLYSARVLHTKTEEEEKEAYARRRKPSYLCSFRSRVDRPRHYDSMMAANKKCHEHKTNAMNLMFQQ